MKRHAACIKDYINAIKNCKIPYKRGTMHMGSGELKTADFGESVGVAVEPGPLGISRVDLVR